MYFVRGTAALPRIPVVDSLSRARSRRLGSAVKSPTFAFAVLITAAAVVPARALGDGKPNGDQPTATMYNWTGLYFGGSVGYGQARSNDNTDFINYGTIGTVLRNASQAK